MLPESFSALLKNQILARVNSILGLTTSLALDIRRKAAFELEESDCKDALFLVLLNCLELRDCIRMYSSASAHDARGSVAAIGDAIDFLLPLLIEWRPIVAGEDEVAFLLSHVEFHSGKIHRCIHVMLESGQFEGYRAGIE